MRGLVCRACLGRVSYGSIGTRSRPTSTISFLLPARNISTQSLGGYFFVTNSSLPLKDRPAPVLTTVPTTSESRNLRTKTSAAIASSTTSQSQDLSTRPLDRRKRAEEVLPQETHTQLPLDASSKLSLHSATLPQQSLRRTATLYLALMKPRLSFLVVLTTAAAYAIYPAPTILLPDTTVTPSLSALTLVFLSSGTALCAASANAFNMLIEPAHDAKMSRTRNRPLVRKLISSRGAALFAIFCGLSGVACLYYGVNPTVSGLGLLNIVLYAGIYTPLKRMSVINTWVGALVGGIPPLMGWAAASGQYATGDGHWTDLLLGPENYGGWLLAALLFAWQFPHFNALSWTIREEYKAAGYKMLAWTNPARNGRVALRYALLFFPICIGLSYAGVTDRGYIVTSSLINVWVAKEAYAFWKMEGHKGSARRLFWAGVWQLPALMVLAMVHKQGLWQNIWTRLFGASDIEVDENDEGEFYQSSSSSVVLRAVPESRT